MATVNGQKTWEMVVTITLTGYENISADTAEEAVRRMEDILDNRVRFDAPLSNMSSVTSVAVAEESE